MGACRVVKGWATSGIIQNNDHPGAMDTACNEAVSYPLIQSLAVETRYSEMEANRSIASGQVVAVDYRVALSRHHQLVLRAGLVEEEIEVFKSGKAWTD